MADRGVALATRSARPGLGSQYVTGMLVVLWVLAHPAHWLSLPEGTDPLSHTVRLFGTGLLGVALTAAACGLVVGVIRLLAARGWWPRPARWGWLGALVTAWWATQAPMVAVAVVPAAAVLGAEAGRLVPRLLAAARNLRTHDTPRSDELPGPPRPERHQRASVATPPAAPAPTQPPEQATPLPPQGADDPDEDAEDTPIRGLVAYGSPAHQLAIPLVIVGGDAALPGAVGLAAAFLQSSVAGDGTTVELRALREASSDNAAAVLAANAAFAVGAPEWTPTEGRDTPAREDWATLPGPVQEVVKAAVSRARGVPLPPPRQIAGEPEEHRYRLRDRDLIQVHVDWLAPTGDMMLLIDVLLRAADDLRHGYGDGRLLRVARQITLNADRFIADATNPEDVTAPPNG